MMRGRPFSKEPEDPDVRRARIMLSNQKFVQYAMEVDETDSDRERCGQMLKTQYIPRLNDVYEMRIGDNNAINQQCSRIKNAMLSIVDDDPILRIIVDEVEKLVNRQKELMPNVSFSNLSSFTLVDHYYPYILDFRRSQFLRPIFIDGCGATFSLDIYTKPCFLHECKMYDRHRMLPMRRLLHLVLHFLLRGHLVKILLPTFYENPYFHSLVQAPVVDNMEIYECLKRQDMIHFIDLEDSPASLTGKMSNLVDEVKACFISRPDVHDVYNRLYANTFTKIDADTSEEEIFSDPRVAACSMRMLTPHYLTHNDTFTIHDSYTRVKFEHEDSVENNKTVLAIDSDIILKYDEDFDEYPAPEIRKSQQLSLSEQVKLLLELCELDEFPPDVLRSIQLILCLAYKVKLRTNELAMFISKYSGN